MFTTYCLYESGITDSNRGESVFWSDATFAMWKVVTSLTNSNIKDLRYIGQSEIHNLFTTSIIDRAAPRTGSRSVTVFNQGEEPFLALLGTPNGVGAVYLLMQHKKALGHKTIDRAFVVRDGGVTDPHLVFHVRDGLSGATLDVGANDSLPLASPSGISSTCTSVHDASINRQLVANT